MKKTKVEEKLDQVFDISEGENKAPKEKDIVHVETANEPKDIVESPQKDDNLEEDFDEIRRSLRRIATRAEEEFEKSSGLAEEMESPRGYEVTGGLLKVALDANLERLSIHEKKRKILEEKSKNTAGNNANITVEGNAVFTGTTADLQKMIEEEKNKNNELEQ